MWRGGRGGRCGEGYGGRGGVQGGGARQEGGAGDARDCGDAEAGRRLSGWVQGGCGGGGGGVRGVGEGCTKQWCTGLKGSEVYTGITLSVQSSTQRTTIYPVQNCHLVSLE